MQQRTTVALLSTLLTAGVVLAGFVHGWPSGDATDGTGSPSSSAALAMVPEPPEDGAVEAVVDHRQGAMSVASGSMSAVGAVVLDGAPFEGSLELYAGALEAVTTDMVDLFPEGSDHAESDALPAVWEDRATFEDRAQDAADAASRLMEAVEEGDQAAMAEAFAGLGGTCSACHEDFRN